MRLLLAFTLAMAASSGASAQSTTPGADLFPDIYGANQQVLVAHQTEDLVLFVTNRGTAPSARGTVTVTFPPDILVTQIPGYFCKATPGSYSEFVCSVQSLYPSTPLTPFNDYAIGFGVLVDRGAGDVTFELSVSSPDQMPVPRVVTLPVYDDPALHPIIDGPDRLDEQNRATIRYSVENLSDRPSGASLRIAAYDPTPPASIDSTGWNCTRETFSLACSTDSLAAHGSQSVSITYQYPSPQQRFTASAAVTPYPPGAAVRFPTTSVSKSFAFARWFQVTNTNDAGPGSLRQAIEDANAGCTTPTFSPGPCGIEFVLDAPAPPSGWFTIQPLSPLPQIAIYDVHIDATKQAKIAGSSRSGPVVFLDGSRAGDAEGLSIAATRGAEVRGLAIGNFARNGLVILPQTRYLTEGSVIGNQFGLDPDGKVAPNGLRGMAATEFSGEIANNVASGNVRSGIYLYGSGTTSVHDNRIGVAADSDAPRPNGASGIFLGGDVDTCEVTGNIIENNKDFGIAVQSSLGALIRQNTMRDNGRLAIDVGLDGPSLAGAPGISSVRRDELAGETVIEGTVNPPGPSFGFYQRLDVYVYLNDSSRPEGQRFLGVAHSVDFTHFRLRIPDVLPSGYVTASSLTVLNLLDEGLFTYTSELGVPFQF